MSEDIEMTSYLEELKGKFFEGEVRPFIEHSLKVIQNEWENKNVFIIEAPTGYGKSTISACLSKYSVEEEMKCVISYPLRSLLEDQHSKFSKVFPEDKIGRRYMHEQESRYLIRPVTLTTVDTLSLTLFGIPPEDLDKVMRGWDGTSIGSMGHYLFSWSSVLLSNLILDEVHLVADSTKSLNFLMALERIAIDSETKLILMSATIPESLKRVLRRDTGEKVELIEFKEDSDKEFINERRGKKYDVHIEKLDEENKFVVMMNWMEENTDDFKRRIVVFNTVKDAVDFYNLVSKNYENVILLHSRFSMEDRANKVNEMRKVIGEEEYLVISTQVIEAGVDVSSDLFITEIAPPNSLIQRLGRFLRYDNEEEGRIYIWYEDLPREDQERYKVYDLDLVNRTLEKLKEMGNIGNGFFHDHEKYKRLLDGVYREEDFSVEEREVNSLVKIMLNLRWGSIEAVRKFLDLEGSFVREGLLVPVIQKDVINDVSSVSDVYDKIIPVSVRAFTGRFSKRVCGAIYSKDGEIEKVEDRKIRLPSKVEGLMRYVIGKRNFIAFLVDCEYDSSRGLMLCDENK
mgnify:CR=1 FL=1